MTAASFRYGFNAGYPNPEFDDQELAELGIRAGVTSERVSLPESHLERWGYEIEVADVTAYSAKGMGSLVGFLTSPTRAHSTAPSSAADWELAHYIPANLHEPITDGNGAINPQNYWAAYVYKTVSTYGKWIKTWEIWNEPDWVSDYRVADAWTTRAPAVADLPRFNGSIFDYVRMLRVSSVAAKAADPEAQIATGGIGYPPFLDAIFRYSDEPKSGAIDAEHPSTGRDYVDVVSFHFYPIYTKGNSDAGVEGFVAQKRAMAAVCDAYQKQIRFECTETGAPHLAVGDYPGGADYAKNYLLKVMALGPEVGMSGIHWFVLSDAAAPSASSDPYDFMGLYTPVGALHSIDEATMTDTGVAYATLTSLVAGATFDSAKTSALRAELPANVRLVAYRDSAQHTRAVVWATATSGETAKQSVSLSSDRQWAKYDWDAFRHGKPTQLSSSGGQVAFDATATPSILVEL